MRRAKARRPARVPNMRLGIAAILDQRWKTGSVEGTLGQGRDYSERRASRTLTLEARAAGIQEARMAAATRTAAAATMGMAPGRRMVGKYFVATRKKP